MTSQTPIKIPDGDRDIVININSENNRSSNSNSGNNSWLINCLIIGGIVIVFNPGLINLPYSNPISQLQLKTPQIYQKSQEEPQTNSTTTCNSPTAKKYGNYKPHDMGKAFFSKVKKIACRLEMPPEYLLAIMGFETGGRFSPSYQNRLSGATGLIQFMPTTAKSLGTSIKQLKQMSPIQQLDYVEKYFLIYRNSITSDLTLYDAYLLVLYPSAVKKGDNDHIFNRKIEYAQNKGLDINKDGKITKVEAGKKVEKYLVSPGFFDNY